jgi:hypothetical protein
MLRMRQMGLGISNSNIVIGSINLRDRGEGTWHWLRGVKRRALIFMIWDSWTGFWRAGGRGNWIVGDKSRV